METRKELWFGLDESVDNTVLDKVFQLNYATVFFPYRIKDRLKKPVPPKRVRFAVFVDSYEEFQDALQDKELSEKIEAFVSDKPELAKKLRESGDHPVGLFLNVRDKKTLDMAAAGLSRFDLMIVEFSDPTNIPLELLLSLAEETRTRIYKWVVNAEDGERSLRTLERGSDGLVLASRDLHEVLSLHDAFCESQKSYFQFKEAVVIGTRNAGMGDRVCIDTTSELFQDEGMLLGSTSSGGIVICSETHYLPYMNLRPFRVNAGALHMYVWGPGNKTSYLSELRAGDEVFAVNTRGYARVVTIGRLKIERRGLLLVEAEIDGVRINAFVQDDWHVRLMGPQGKPLPSTEIKVGDKLLGYVDEAGRHVGIKITETIKEL